MLEVERPTKVNAADHLRSRVGMPVNRMHNRTASEKVCVCVKERERKREWIILFGIGDVSRSFGSTFTSFKLFNNLTVQFS